MESLVWQERLMQDNPTSKHPLLCPSAQPHHAGGVVFGVQAVRDDGERQVGYLTELLPASPEVLNLASPAKPTEVLRIAASCMEGGCKHFNGTACKLATRIVDMLDPAVSSLPRCLIRRSCRWFRQEGGAACLRCPQVVTDQRNASALQLEVAGPGAEASSP